MLAVAMALTGIIAGASPKVGDVAPDFATTDTDGHEVKLSELVKKGTVVLAFFPKAFTGG